MGKSTEISRNMSLSELFDDALILNESNSKKLLTYITAPTESPTEPMLASSEEDKYSIKFYETENNIQRAIIWPYTSEAISKSDYTIITNIQLKNAGIQIKAQCTNKEKWQSWVIATSSLYVVWASAAALAKSSNYSASNMPLLSKLELLPPLDSLFMVGAPILPSLILFVYRLYKHHCRLISNKGDYRKGDEFKAFIKNNSSDLLIFNVQMRGMMIGHNIANHLVKTTFEWSLESIAQIAIHSVLSGALSGAGLIVAHFLLAIISEGIKAARNPKPNENRVAAFFRGFTQAATDFVNQDNLKLFGAITLVSLLMTALGSLLPPVAAIVVTVLIISAVNYWVLNKAKPTNEMKVIHNQGLFSKPFAKGDAEEDQLGLESEGLVKST